MVGQHDQQLKDAEAAGRATAGRVDTLTGELNLYAAQLGQGRATMEEKLGAHLVEIEGTLRKCDGILGEMQQLSASTAAQVAASPSVFAQDITSIKRAFEEMKQHGAKVQADIFNGLSAEIENMRGTILATSALMQG